jgi:HAD superfamily hydrolase (TIGR01450 family)
VAPEIPADVRPQELDRSVRDELRSLTRPLADTVAGHLVAAGRLIEEDPPAALAHALAARQLASRISAVREAVGVAAYHAGDWRTAIAELRTYHRMTGRFTHLAVLADCERALGRPERAIDLFRSAPLRSLEPPEAVELLIVVAGARADLGQHEAAVAMLQVPELTGSGWWVPRLRYAYADALLAAGRPQQAREWFARTLDADEDGETDAADRMLELDGVVVAEAPDVSDPDVSDRDVSEPGIHEPDPTGQPAGRLVDPYDLVVLDLDGVVYLGDQPVPGAAETIAQLRRDGPAVVFATNNASRSPDEVASLLAGLGVPATAAEVYTAAAAAADELARLLEPGAAVLVVGTEALEAEVRRAGLRPVRQAHERPAAVVQGYGPRVGWVDLAEACVAIRAGARWVVTNTDATLPTERGPLPGNGALVAALRTALDRDPDLVAGKPEPGFFRSVVARAGARRALVVGDRLDTDVDGARRAGLDSLLVFTGVDREPDVAARPPGSRPTHLGADLGVLLAPRGSALA